MGCFSWIYCDTNKPLRIKKSAYVLIPKEFSNKMKCKNIYEPSYDGYGYFGGYDIYDLVAEWNRNFLSENMLCDKPRLEDYIGLNKFEKDNMRKAGASEEMIVALDMSKKESYYKMALKEYEKSVSRLMDYRNGMSDNEMKKKYGSGWKSEIGVDIACYDEQNTDLPYPIKIAEKTALYEMQPASKKDPNQGCY